MGCLFQYDLGIFFETLVFCLFIWSEYLSVSHLTNKEYCYFSNFFLMILPCIFTHINSSFFLNTIKAFFNYIAKPIFGYIVGYNSNGIVFSFLHNDTSGWLQRHNIGQSGNVRAYLLLLWVVLDWLGHKYIFITMGLEHSLFIFVFLKIRFICLL